MNEEINDRTSSPEVQKEETAWAPIEPIQKKKNKTPWLILLAAIIVGGGIFGAMRMGWLGGGPKKEVNKAMFSLLEGEQNPYTEEWLGQKALAKELAKGHHVDAHFELVDIAGPQAPMEGFSVPIPKGLTLGFSSQQHVANNQSLVSFGIGQHGSDLLGAKFFLNNQKLQLAAPGLFKEVLSADYSGDLDAKLDAAPLVKEGVIKKDMVKTLLESLRDQSKSIQNLQKIFNGDMKSISYLKPAVKEFNQFQNRWVIEKVDPLKATWNGKEESVKGYRVTMKKEDILAFMRGMKDVALKDPQFRKNIMDPFMLTEARSKNITLEEAYKKADEEASASLKKMEEEGTIQDQPFVIHMTKDQKLVSLVLEGKTEEMLSRMEILRMGGDFPNQNMKIVITGKDLKAKDKSEDQTLEFLSKGTTENGIQTRTLTASIKEGEASPSVFTMTSTLNAKTGETQSEGSLKIKASKRAKAPVTIPDSALGFKSKGQITDVVKGKSMTQRIDALDFDLNGSHLATLKGEIKSSGAPGEIRELNGEALDLLKASRSEWNALEEQIEANLKLLLTTFMQSGLE